MGSIPTHGPKCQTRTREMTCQCGQTVYHLTCTCGSAVRFDEKNPPWPQHSCKFWLSKEEKELREFIEYMERERERRQMTLKSIGKYKLIKPGSIPQISTTGIVKSIQYVDIFQEFGIPRLNSKWNERLGPLSEGKLAKVAVVCRKKTRREQEAYEFYVTREQLPLWFEAGDQVTFEIVTQSIRELWPIWISHQVH